MTKEAPRFNPRPCQLFSVLVNFAHLLFVLTFLTLTDYAIEGIACHSMQLHFPKLEWIMHSIPYQRMILTALPVATAASRTICSIFLWVPVATIAVTIKASHTRTLRLLMHLN